MTALKVTKDGLLKIEFSEDVDRQLMRKLLAMDYKEF